MDAHSTQQVAEAGAKYQDLAWMVLASPLICGAGSWFLARRLRGVELTPFGGSANERPALLSKKTSTPRST